MFVIPEILLVLFFIVLLMGLVRHFEFQNGCHLLYITYIPTTWGKKLANTYICDTSEGPIYRFQ